jgi:hypothetical protein
MPRGTALLFGFAYVCMLAFILFVAGLFAVGFVGFAANGNIEVALVFLPLVLLLVFMVVMLFRS